MAHLQEKDGENRSFPLPENETAVIGRSAGKCNVTVPGLAVSGIHATLSRGPDAFVLRDLASTNGTKLGGEEVAPETDVKVYRGDAIVFGDFAVTLEGDDVPVRPADAPAPAPASPAPVPLSEAAPSAPAPIVVAPPSESVSDKVAGETHIKIAPVRAGAAVSPLDFSPRSAADASAPLPGQFRRKGGAAKIWAGVLVVVVLVVAVLVYLIFGGL